MILFRDYNTEERVDRIWYESSNIYYSECQDTPNDYKTLTVVFKNGGRYVYKNVDVKDYVIFVRGGVDNSNGKALNKLIKAKYECEKLEPANMQELEKLKESLTEKRKLLAEANKA